MNKLELLQQKILEYNNLPDWKISELLNSQDLTLPPIIKLVSVKVGPGLLMETIGADEGAALLDSMTQLSQLSSTIKWAMKLIEKDGIDASSITFREQLDGLVQLGRITAENAGKIKALAEVTYYPSWAEHNQVEVTARTVGLARGGK